MRKWENTGSVKIDFELRWLFETPTPTLVTGVNTTHRPFFTVQRLTSKIFFLESLTSQRTPWIYFVGSVLLPFFGLGKETLEEAPIEPWTPRHTVWKNILEYQT